MLIMLSIFYRPAVLNILLVSVPRIQEDEEDEEEEVEVQPKKRQNVKSSK